MVGNNGLRNVAHLTQSALQRALAGTVSDIQNGDTDQDMADAWGVSAGTVANVRNHNHTLSLMGFLHLGERFGPKGLDRVLALIGLQASNRDAVVVTADDLKAIPQVIVDCLPTILRHLGDGTYCRNDHQAFEEAGIVDSFLEVADKMRAMRDAARGEA